MTHEKPDVKKLAQEYAELSDFEYAKSWKEIIQIYLAGYSAAQESLEREVDRLREIVEVLLENAECRGDEDCDHCWATHVYSKLYPKPESKEGDV